MTKRITALFLLLSFVFSNIGLAVNLHYCQGVIEQVEFGLAANLACAHEEKDLEANVCCGEVLEEECCSNETFQQNSENITVQLVQIQLPHFVIIESYVFQLFEEQVETPYNKIFSYEVASNAPPLYKLYKKYIYYS